MKRYIFSLAVLLSPLFLLAQGSNVFLERAYWAKNPSVPEIKQKMKEGNDILEMTGHGWDATLNAIFTHNPIETITFLLDQGQDINRPTHHANNYLMWAAYVGDLPVMELLLKRGSQTDIINSHGQSLIQHVALSGKPDPALYEFCIANGGTWQDRDEDGKTLLLTAISRLEGPQFLSYFLDKGLDLNARDNEGNGAFLYAASGGNLDLLKYLVDKGVDYGPNKETKENAFLFATRGRNMNPSLELFKYFESLGIDPTIANKEGENALINLAASQKDKALFDYFIAAGINPNTASKEGNLPFILASSRSDLALVKYWLDHTEDINAVNAEGYSALTNAIRYNKPEVVEFLIEKGLNTKMLDADGNDLGHHLVDAFNGKAADFSAKLDLLTKNGYEVRNAKTSAGTLLHLALDKESKDLFSELLKRGLDVNAKDSEGYTTLHYAAMKSKNKDILEFLIAKGADVGIKTELGESVWDLASENELLKPDLKSFEFLKKSK